MEVAVHVCGIVTRYPWRRTIGREVDSKVWRKFFEPFGNHRVQSCKLWACTPVLLLPYRHINVVDKSYVANNASHVGKVARDKILVVIEACTWSRNTEVNCLQVHCQIIAS